MSRVRRAVVLATVVLAASSVAAPAILRRSGHGGAGSAAPRTSPTGAPPRPTVRPGTTTTSTVPLTLRSTPLFPLGRTPTAADPLRVMLIGDSVMHEAGPGIAAALQATGAATVSNNSFPGWGLTIDHAYRDHLAGLVAVHRAEVVIGTWSWDDRMAATDPAGYRALLDDALSVMLRPGDGVRGVIFLEFPKIDIPPGGPALSQASVEADRQAWNTIAAQEAEAHPGRVAYLAVAGAIELDGRFSYWLPRPGGGWVRIRKVDGTHLCPAGAALLGAAVDDALAPAWGLPVRQPGWDTAAWTADPLYDTPPGSCPADQPPGVRAP